MDRSIALPDVEPQRPAAAHRIDSERTRTSLALRVLASMAATCLLEGCMPVYSVRVPLMEGTESASTGATDIVVEDKRPASERKAHLSVGMWSCERWYGDETFVPGKIEYLKKLLGERLQQGKAVRLTLQRFDTMENCQNTEERHATGLAAAAAATGGIVVSRGAAKPAPRARGAGYDHPTMLVRLAGDVNGVAFDVSREVSYADIDFDSVPTTDPVYVERIRKVMGEIADEVAARVRGAGSSS
jgi:hypothetical protein